MATLPTTEKSFTEGLLARMRRCASGAWEAWGGVIEWLGTSAIVAAALIAVYTFVSLPVKAGEFKDYIEGCAVLATGLYFLKRISSGYFVVNLSMRVATERARKDDAEDWVAVAVTMSKGDRGKLVLHDAQVRVTPSTEGMQSLSVGRLGHTQVESWGAAHQRRIEWNQPHRGAPLLNVTPGEELTLSAHVTVPRERACLVEAVVIGRGPSRGTSQHAHPRPSFAAPVSVSPAEGVLRSPPSPDL